MFGLGMPELIIIMIVALVIFGPRKLPEIGAQLGRGLREFKKGAQSFKEDISEAVDAEGLKDMKGEVASVGDSLGLKDIRQELSSAIELPDLKSELSGGLTDDLAGIKDGLNPLKSSTPAKETASGASGN